MKVLRSQNFRQTVVARNVLSRTEQEAPKKTKFVSHLLFKVCLLALPSLQAIFKNLVCQQIISGGSLYCIIVY
jgi:hypothetical protein